MGWKCVGRVEVRSGCTGDVVRSGVIRRKKVRVVDEGFGDGVG